MAFRLLLPPSGGTPGITPTPDAGWNFTTGFDRVVPSLTETNTAFATKTVTDATATANRDALAKQFVYPLPTGTVFATTQTIKGRVLCAEGANASNLRSQVRVRVIASNGSTVQATLYAGDTTTGTSNPTSEWALNTLTNRQMPRGTTVAVAANYTSVAGDHLVIEIGYRKHAAASTTGTLRFGDNAVTNLPEDETTTTDLDTWIEFSGSLPSAPVTVAVPVLAATGAVSLPSMPLNAPVMAATGAASLPTLPTRVPAMAASGAAPTPTMQARLLVPLFGGATLMFVSVFGAATQFGARQFGEVALIGSSATAGMLTPTITTGTSQSIVAVPVLAASAALPAQPWTPDVLPGSILKRWFAADRNAVQTNGTILTEWTDASPNASPIPAGPTPGTIAPTIVTNQLNGLPIIRFANGGTAVYFTTGTGSIGLDSQPLSVVFVSKAVSGGTDDVFTSSSTGAWTWIALVDGGFYAAVRAGGTQGSYGASGPGYTRNLWQIHTAVFNGASSRGSINGDPDDTFSVGTDALEYGLQIGINLLFTADRMDGDIAEIAFINGALTTAEEQTWQGYFAWKYGLVGNLPSGHPYKTTHPGFAVIAREPVPVSAASGAALAPTLPLTAPVAAASAAIPTVVERAIAQVPVSAATAAFLTPNVLVASFVIAPVLAANGAWLSLILPLMASAMTATGAMATPTMRDIEAAPVLAGTAAALTPTMRDIETAPVAAATGTALVPVVPLTVPAAQASGAVPAVTEQAIEIVPASQATGAALTPTMRAIESLPALAATGASLVPTLPLILPTLAATGVLLTPSLGGALILGVPVLPATAAALTPTMRAIAQVPAAQAGARMVKPWTPTVYSGSQLIRWLDASQESATDGATLTVGRDWSPNHVDFTGEPLATDGPHLGVAPTFHTNVQNGLPAYHFAETSVGVYFKTGPLSALASQPMSVIFVAKPAAVSPGFNWEDVWTAIDGSSTPSATPAVTRDGGGDWLLITKDAGSENITIGHNDAADWQVVAAVVNGATSKGSLDGTIVTGTTRTTVNLGDGILIGFDYVFPENLFQGDIGEVIIAAGAWTDSDLDILNGYLHHKWGLAARLPSTHPYKANPPTIADQVAVLARSVVPAMPAAGAVLTPTMVARQGVPVAPATASVLTPMFPLLAPVLSATGVLLAPTSGGQLLLTVPLLTAAGALLAPMLPWNVTVAAATGSALVPSFPLVAPAMSATGAVPAVTERAIEQAAILAATGAFLTPSLTGQLTVTAPVLAATGAALAPAFPLLASVLTASGAVPALTLPRIAPVLSASGTWLDATARVTETAPALTASGAFLLPGVAEQVAAPILSASGAALAPTLPTTQRFDVELLAAGAGLVPPSLAAIAAMPVLTATAGMLVPFFSGRMYLDIPALTATAALLAASTMTPLPVPILSASGDAHAPGILVVVRATILGATGDLLAVGIPVAFALRLPSDLRAPVSRVAATAPVIAVLGVPVRQTNGHAPAAETLEVPTMILDGTAPRS